ncbi:MAG: hypothetical protein ACM34K_03025 [Bacillota bacterium]
MSLISFVFKSRLKFYFTGKGAPSRIAGLTGFSLLALFYGFALGYFIDSSYYENMSFDSQNFIKGINLFIFMSTVTRAYLPSYRPKQDFISGVYPLVFTKRYMLDLMIDYLFPYFLVFLLFLSMMKASSFVFDSIYYFQSILVLLSAHIIRRLVQTIAERKIKLKFIEILLVISGSAAAIFVLLQNNILELRHNILSLLLTLTAYITFLLVDYLLSGSVVEQKKLSSAALFEKGIFNTFSTTFIFKNKAARKTILVAFILKLLIMAVDLIMMAQYQAHLFNNIYVVWLYVSPLILYSYIYSNTWGFYRSLWLTVDKCTSGFRPLFKIQMRIMFIPFLADFMLAAIYFTITGVDVAFGFLFYFISLMIVISLSVYSSLVSARYVEKPLSFRANSSMAYRIAAVVLIISIVAVKYYPIAVWGLILYLAGSVILVRLSFTRYEKYKFDVFDRLFKSGSLS